MSAHRVFVWREVTRAFLLAGLDTMDKVQICAEGHQQHFFLFGDDCQSSSVHVHPLHSKRSVYSRIATMPKLVIFVLSKRLR